MRDSQTGPEPVQSEDKIMLVLSYLGLFCLIPFFITKNEYVKWHSKQGLTLCIIGAVIGIVLQILVTILLAMAPSLVLLGTALSGLFSLGMLVLVVMAIIKALGGIRWPIPFVADLAAKLFK